jgi:hypothetical protein
MTSLTKATCAELRTREVAETDKALTKLVQEAPSYVEAIRITNKCKAMGLKTVPTYKGEAVPDSFDFSVTVKEAVVDPITQKQSIVDRTVKQAGVVVQAVKTQYRRDKAWEAVWGVPSSMVDATWVVGYDSDQFTPYKRQKLEKFCEDKGIKRASKASYGSPQPEGVTTFIFVRQLPEAHAHWIEPKSVLKWEDIKAVKIEKEKRTDRMDGRPTGSYDAFVAGQSEGGIPAGDLKTTNLFWINSSVRNGWGGHPEPQGLKALLKLHPDATVVTLQQNRVEKFRRDFPKAQNLREYLLAKATEWEKGVSLEDKLAYVVQHDYNMGGLFKGLDPEKLTDKALHKLVKLANRSLTTLENDVSRWNNYKRLELAAAKTTFDKIVGSYALLGYLTRVTGRDKNDLYVYLNAAHAARKEV